MPIIDAHLPLFTKVSPEFPREVTTVMPADREEPVEKLLGVMEENGVDQAVLTQIGGADLEQHSYQRKCLT